MTEKKQFYPDHLNPFGSDDEAKQEATTSKQPNEYPDHLSPFGGAEHDDNDEYDASLNPFGCEDSPDKDTKIDKSIPESESKILKSVEAIEEHEDTPFNSDELSPQEETDSKESHSTISATSSQTGVHKLDSTIRSSTAVDQSNHLECPPIPLPRTKSLLKKELAKCKQLEQQPPNREGSCSRNSPVQHHQPTTGANHVTIKPPKPPPPPYHPPNTIQRSKNKRNAPPVPVNFKRQVCGSLDEIEKELNEIGDSLEGIEKEFITCQEATKAYYNVDTEKFAESQAKLIEMIKKKGAVVRHQKELMYRKRELKLEQIHSDIEYELRMIGNKQLSNRTTEDEVREKELLRSLVEIVEEKSDIVENLNKLTLCDNQDIEDTFRRLNIRTNFLHQTKEAGKSSKKDRPEIEGDNCDKVKVAKFSKIATLLPKTGNIKGKIKMKRNHLFKKSNSHTLNQ